MEVILQRGLPDHLRADAAALYWQAFGSKLGRVMGPDAKALKFLVKVIRCDHVIVALDQNGALLGMAGFKTHAGSFAGGEMKDLFSIYGRLGALWRLPLLWLLASDTDNERFLLDGLCVTRNAQNQGIGTALMDAIDQEADARGYSHVRLDVIDSNWRAKALYHRLGFVVERTQSIGVLRLFFGFNAATTMVKPLVRIG